MTPQELKNSILQLAIQGKLVEQRPEEGSAEELYRQIQEEKKRLVKEKKIKKEKTLPEITEEEVPFDIPESWKWVRFAFPCAVLNGDRGKNYPAKSTLSHTGIPFISALNLDGTTVLDDERLLRMSDEQYNKLGNGKLKKDDIVVCIRGSLGKHGRYPFDKGAIASSLVIVRPFSPDDIFAEYIMRYLDSPLFFSEIIRYDNGTAQPNLAAKSLEQFLLPLPPLAEQKRIVAKIEKLLPLIDRYEQAWSKLEAFNKRFLVDMQKSILQMAIQGKLVEQKSCEQADSRHIDSKKKAAMEECVFEIPDTWYLGTLESICETIPTKQYQILEKEVQPVGKYPVISQSKEYQIGFSDNDDKVCRVDEAIIAFGDHTAVVKYIDFDFIVGADGVKLFKPNGSIYFKYLFYALQVLTNGLDKIGGYSRHYKFIKNKPIPVPPLAEQKRIVAKIEELLPLCEQLK